MTRNGYSFSRTILALLWYGKTGYLRKLNNGHGCSMTKRLRICLINPKFGPSYWGFDYALPLYPGNKKSSMILGALPYLAGLIPDRYVSLLDENVEEISWPGLGTFDIVGVTGMNVQKERCGRFSKGCGP